MKNKNLCIIQARMGSTRLPNKILMEVGGVSLLEYEINRVWLAKKIDKIVIATGEGRDNDRVEELCKKIGVDYFRGSEDDVLDRYYQCSLKYPDSRNIVRITGDCPLIDPVVIDEVIGFFENNNFDYAGNTLKETYPDGLDTEIFSRDALVDAAKNAKLVSEREHMTQYIIKNNKFKKGNWSAPYDWSHFRLTVDEAADFEVIKFLIENSKPDEGYLGHIAFLTKYPDIMAKNMKIIRNEGLLKSLKNDHEIK